MSGVAWEIPLRAQAPNVAVAQKQTAEAENEGLRGIMMHAQTGLVNEQATAARQQNQLLGARIPALIDAYQGGSGGGAGAPGGGGISSYGQQAQPTTGPGGGDISSYGQQAQPTTGPGGRVMQGQFSGLSALPNDLYLGLLSAKPEELTNALKTARTEKQARIGQDLLGIMDPQTGQVDPAAWDAMVRQHYQQGLATDRESQALLGHPEMAPHMLNAAGMAKEQPYYRGQTTGAEAGARAPFEYEDIPSTDAAGNVTTHRMRKSDIPQGAGATSVNPQLNSAISQASRAYGVPADLLTTFNKIENPSGNPDGTSPTGAAGNFQITGGFARQFGVNNPRDDRQAAMGTARSIRENTPVLEDGLGRAPTPSDLYLAHQQGPEGAITLLQNPNKLATQALQDAGINPRNVLVNGGSPNMTAGQFTQMWAERFNAKLGGATPQAAPTQAAPGAAGPRGSEQPWVPQGAPAVFGTASLPRSNDELPPRAIGTPLLPPGIGGTPAVSQQGGPTPPLPAPPPQFGTPYAGPTGIGVGKTTLSPQSQAAMEAQKQLQVTQGTNQISQMGEYQKDLQQHASEAKIQNAGLDEALALKEGVTTGPITQALMPAKAVIDQMAQSVGLSPSPAVTSGTVLNGLASTVLRSQIHSTGNVRAASEWGILSRSIPSAATPDAAFPIQAKGLQGFNDYTVAKQSAAAGTNLNRQDFESAWNANVNPMAFIMARMPADVAQKFALQLKSAGRTAELSDIVNQMTQLEKFGPHAFAPMFRAPEQGAR